MVTWEELDKLLETDLHKEEDEVIPQEEPRPDIASETIDEQEQTTQFAHQPESSWSSMMDKIKVWCMRFPFLTKNFKREQVCYGGDQNYSTETVEPYMVHRWYEDNKNNFKEIKETVFGEPYILTLPAQATPMDPSNTIYHNVTNEFVELLGILLTNRIIKEKNFRVWQKIIAHYDLYEQQRPDPIPNLHIFVLKQLSYESLKQLKQNNELNVLDPRYKLKLTVCKEAQNFPAIQDLSLQEIQELCAMKEFLEGKIKFKPFFLKGKKIEMPYQTVHLQTQPGIEVPGHYTTSVRFAMFWDERYYKRVRPGQTLQPWQWIAKLHTGWVTSVVAARRSGKSYWAIDEAVEMFTSDSQDRSRPIRVLFVGINTKKLKTVIKYLLSFTKKFTEAGYFERESSKNIMHYRSNSTTKKASASDDLGTIEFIGSKDEDAWVGDYADLIIIDECERIAENVREDILPIITNEWARAILISTLNKNSQKTWFYNQLIQGETEEIQRWLIGQDVVTVIRQMRAKRVQPVMDKVRQISEEENRQVPFEEWINWIDIEAMKSDMRYTRQRVWLRFTGEDSDLKTEKEKSFARDRLRWTKAYYPEWWAIFPEDTQLYDYEGSIKDPDYFQWINQRRYKFVCLAYDPAESRDKAALVYMGYNSTINKIEVFKIDKLPNNYTYHWPFIANALKECEQYIEFPEQVTSADRSPASRVFFAYDYNGVGQGLEPFFHECKIPIALKLRFTGQGWITKKWNHHNVAKELLVNMLQNTMDHGAFIINSDCKEFLEELGHYKSYYNAETGNTKYQAEQGFSDDFVSAAMIWTYFCLEYMGEKSNIVKNETEQSVDEDENFSVEWMYQKVEKIVMTGLNQWKTVQQIVDEYNGSSQRNNLKRQDILSQFWY